MKEAESMLEFLRACAIRVGTAITVIGAVLLPTLFSMIFRRAGLDGVLLMSRSTPKPVPFPAEAGKPFDDVIVIR